MPAFEPFPGLRYSLTHVSSLDDVVCPPYDVISEEERYRLAARSPSNIVRIELPVAEDGTDPYDGARRLLDSWRDGGVLRRDRQPAFYGLRTTSRDSTGSPRCGLGVLGALALEGPGSGIVPHEQTTPKAKSDRLDLLRATRTNVSPIWGLSPSAGLSALLAPPAHPAAVVHDSDGVMHELWPITDPDAIWAIAEAVGDAPVLIADGHHRYETALAFQAEERASNGDRPGDHDAVLALVVELSEDQLAVDAIHRLVAGLPRGFDPLAGLEDSFELLAGTFDSGIGARMLEAGALGVVTPAGTWLARPRPELVATAEHDLDASRLEAALASWPAHELAFQHGAATCVEAVTGGKADVAFLLRPATIAQISAIGSGGRRMPPKTTFFWPKPRTGLVLRELID